jgi:hypothetical protein
MSPCASGTDKLTGKHCVCTCISVRASPRHGILTAATPLYTTELHGAFYSNLLRYPTLRCPILCCAVLCCVVLWYHVMSLNLAYREPVRPTTLITPISSHTNSVTAMASAQEMCAILEAYWQLSAKRLTDNMCMLVDREILGTYALNSMHSLP